MEILRPAQKPARKLLEPEPPVPLIQLTIFLVPHTLKVDEPEPVGPVGPGKPEGPVGPETVDAAPDGPVGPVGP